MRMSCIYTIHENMYKIRGYCITFRLSSGKYVYLTHKVNLEYWKKCFSKDIRTNVVYNVRTFPA